MNRLHPTGAGEKGGVFLRSIHLPADHRTLQNSEERASRCDVTLCARGWVQALPDVQAHVFNPHCENAA
jgi:hypothetical protein